MGKVNSALAALPWVEENSVDFKNNKATLVVNADDYDEEATVQCLQKLGYGVSVL